MKKTNSCLTNEQLAKTYKGRPRFGYGIDVGGSGIKGAYVDLKKGKLASARHRIPTPTPSNVENVLSVIKELVDNAKVPEHMPIGLSFPGPFRGNVIVTIGNFDSSFKGKNLVELVEKKLNRTVICINDADAAAFAESKYGAAQNEKSTIVVLTLGTGIGSAIIYNQKLIPNLEFGHIQLHGDFAERYASSKVKEDLNLSYKEYASRLQEYIDIVNLVLNPVKIVVGGGISQNANEFLPLIKSVAEIVPAKLRNQAGIVGAAKLASIKHF
jgi:polyphosphate glucokinase